MDPSVPSLASVLAQVPDPRHARGRRHAWPALLLLIVVALLSGTLLLLRLWLHRDITAARQHYGHHPAALVRRLTLPSRRH